MKSLTYLAVFKRNDDDSYHIYFPDLPGCSSCGKSLEDAQRMATEAAYLHIYGLECDKKDVPAPSDVLARKDTENNIIMPITIYPELFRVRKDNERVKTNTTIPAWLKRVAEEKNVNYSRLLEAALSEFLQIQQQ